LTRRIRCQKRADQTRQRAKLLKAEPSVSETASATIISTSYYKSARAIYPTGMTTILTRFQPRAHLATAALLSFMLSFIAARLFTTFFPSTVLVSSGVHIHHFWFGIALLAIGGWLGISFSDKEIDRIAAIIYGAGGGLIVDEVGLLLTFGNYQTGLTYTFFTIFLAFISILSLLYRYWQTILTEFAEFVGNKIGLYIGVFLLAVSIAFITETNNALVTGLSSALTITAVIIIITYLALRIKKFQKTKQLDVKELH
jgi:hypothetical protein